MSGRWVGVLVALGFLVGVLIDTILVAAKLRWLSRVVGVELDIILFGTPFSVPRFGVIVPFLSLLLTIGALLVPFGSWRRAAAWRQAGAAWVRVNLWTLAVPVLLILGAFLAKLLDGVMPGWLKAFAGSFGVAAKVFIFDHEFFPVDGSILSLLGLVVGIYLLVRFVGRERIGV